MEWKKSFKPSLINIFGSIIITVISFFKGTIGGEWVGQGFPLWFYETIFCHPGIPDCSSITRWNIGGLIFDLVFWYLIISLILLIYYKLKK